MSETIQSELVLDKQKFGSDEKFRQYAFLLPKFNVAILPTCLLCLCYSQNSLTMNNNIHSIMNFH
jgi:hypothetical protein